MSQSCVLLGCGILAKEVRYLIAKNAWPLEADFLDSSLHIDFEALQTALQAGLKKHAQESVMVFYGCCHPHMDSLLAAAKTFRSEGQNCVEMLLGREQFMQELEQGAFFLLEDWALRWDEIIGKTFGGNPAVTREIFQLSSRYLLALRTPCSGDFEQAAIAAAEKVGLPLHWRDVGLEHLERVLCEMWRRRQPMTEDGTG